MIKNIKILFVFTLLLIVGNACGQVVSGLKGDRLFVNVAPQFSMLPKKGLGPISMYGELEYVVKNYKSIVARVGYSNAPSSFDWIDQTFGYDSPLENAKGEYVTRTFSGTFAMKSYRRKRGDLAPLGQYWLWGGKVNSTRIDITHMIVEGKKGHRYDGGVFDYMAVVPIIGFGKNSMLAPKLLLNWEINSELDLFSFGIDSAGDPDETYFINQARRNNFYWNLFQLKLGVSYAL